ncbi:Aminomethyltransferase folate-binding domain-containing protein [Gigaspora margarita]|uniref:Aminomethyltransferase folate-binding domain-containing protein n=1 Tax=Gigaspora margarita TaxID=4874 RepID=A0A8H3X292_GIGMA|nr:Aminomethyltransferase folate-binding domain-containing protein [Gigaspora margarita]
MTMYKWKTLARSLTLKRQFSVSTLQSDHYVQVPDRGLVEVGGEDSIKFLQGLITNHMLLIQSSGDGFYTAFSNPIEASFKFELNPNRLIPKHP